jgi:hypothetical protein
MELQAGKIIFHLSGCYELFSDRKNGRIGVARFLGI